MQSYWMEKPPTTRRKIWRNDTLTTTKPASIGLVPNPSFRNDTPGNNSLCMARSFERTTKSWCTIVTLKLCYPSWQQLRRSAYHHHCRRCLSQLNILLLITVNVKKEKSPPVLGQTWNLYPKWRQGIGLTSLKMARHLRIPPNYMSTIRTFDMIWYIC